MRNSSVCVAVVILAYEYKQSREVDPEGDDVVQDS